MTSMRTEPNPITTVAVVHPEGRAHGYVRINASDFDPKVHTKWDAEQAPAPLSTDHLWSQPEAAYFLGCSARYLRESSCPKVLLPGTGKKGQPLVRYDPKAVREWAAQWSTNRRQERIA